MTAMPNSPGQGTRAGFPARSGFKDERKDLAGLTAGWLLLALGAFGYARFKGIPGWAALPVAAAFLIEIPFYLSPAFAAQRAWLANQPKSRAALMFAASAILPWLVYAPATGEALAVNFMLLLAVALIVSFWYVALPAAPAADALFLAVVAAVYLSRVFDRIYLSPIPKLSISVLGHLMLIRTAGLAVLVLRGNVRAEYRFLPDRKEWLAGLRYFAMMLPVIALAYWALGLVTFRARFNSPGLTILLVIGTFLVILSVVALSEEFFFRGLLQQWLEQWTGSRNVALVAAALVFGSAHLGFHRVFPNWRWAIVAAILGVFCGLAWRNSRSVQAAMVAHALIATVWKVFLQ
jgi:membrane protease YdiL (CAAX protease family)